MKALIFLEARLFSNSIINLTRSPKRMVPGLIFFAWIFASLINAIQAGRYSFYTGAGRYGFLSTVALERIEVSVFIFIASICAAVIYNAFDAGIMTFSVSDIDFLFATPLLRRDVLMFRLLKDYLKYTIWVLMLGLLFLPIISGSFSGLGLSLMPDGLVPLSAIISLIFLVVNIAHMINISFSFGFQRLQTAGVAVKTVLIAIPALAVIYTIYQFIQTHDFWMSLLWVVDSPVIKYLFAPARWSAKLCLSPLVGVSALDWAHLWVLWILAGGSFLVLLGKQENIYEPAIKTSIDSANRRAAGTAGDWTQLKTERLRARGRVRRGRLTLPKNSGPLKVLFWQRVLLRLRASTLRVLFAFLLPILVAVYISVSLSDTTVLAYLPPLAIVYISFFMAIPVQVEVRSDLKYAMLLKSTPIPGMGVVLMQVLGNLLYTVPAMVAMGLTFWIMAPAARSEYLIAAVIAGSVLIFPYTAIFVMAGLMYPNTKDTAQNYLCVLVGMLVTGIMMGLATIVALFVIWNLRMGPMYAALAVSLVSLVLGVAVISIAGEVYKAFEPSGD